MKKQKEASGKLKRSSSNTQPSTCIQAEIAKITPDPLVTSELLAKDLEEIESEYNGYIVRRD